MMRDIMDNLTKQAESLIEDCAALQHQVLKKFTVSMLEEVRSEILRLRSLASQRCARMQVLRESFREIDWEHACLERPEMRDWFDKNGIPK